MAETMLCRNLPPPPNDVPQPAPASAGGSTRQRFEKHSQNACATACHGLLDPLGFAFEHYDTIGKYRTMDNGVAVDASGSVELDGKQQSFTSIVDLSAHLAASGETRTCFALEMMRFALQRGETTADSASFYAAKAAFSAPTSTVQDVLTAVATSRTFRYRTPSPGEVMP